MRTNIYFYRYITAYVHEQNYQVIGNPKSKKIVNTKLAETKQGLAQNVCTEITRSELSSCGIHTSTQQHTQQASNYTRGAAVLALAHSDDLKQTGIAHKQNSAQARLRISVLRFVMGSPWSWSCLPSGLIRTTYVIRTSDLFACQENLLSYPTKACSRVQQNLFSCATNLLSCATDLLYSLCLACEGRDRRAAYREGVGEQIAAARHNN